MLLLLAVSHASISQMGVEADVSDSGFLKLSIISDFSGSAGSEVMLNLSGDYDSVSVRDGSGLVLPARIENGGGSTLIFATVPVDRLEYALGSNSLSAKQGSVWSIDLSIGASENISSLAASLSLPEGAEVKGTNGAVRGSGDSVETFWSAQNIDTAHVARFRVSYATPAPADESGPDYPIMAAGGALAALVIAFLFFSLRKKKGQIAKAPPVPIAAPPPAPPIAHSGNVIDSLDETDREIVREIISRGGKTTQAQLYLNLHIPKATLSRRMASLENRGLLIRSQKGNRKLVSIGPLLRA